MLYLLGRSDSMDGLDASMGTSNDDEPDDINESDDLNNFGKIIKQIDILI